jgi:hypothetical protein
MAAPKNSLKNVKIGLRDPSGGLPSNMQLDQRNKVVELRERIITRDNWNYFVGDQEFKTDFFLRFQN